ncbi:hypothetical protein PENPOL_c005G04042 [Penicillium polonicum]|uniref:GDP/GTP exchange factor Sec2 N-terminal domain-containing protein n=1 Tax=Penicillium polonicum TaxID=60169 RepID=A0A1V6NMI8_PENPO|nr:hypothetical protein PENPOL_c005G04042 [Penicillium polonicum]
MLSMAINSRFFVSSLSTSLSFVDYHSFFSHFSLVNQGSPHRITPLVDPDTAHSSSRGVRPSPTQREVSALNERLADAEAVISRQESELDYAKSQASALRSEMAAKRHTTLKNRAQDIEAQLGIIEDQLDQTAVSLELAEGKKNTLQDCKKQIAKDQADLRDLRQIITTTEYNIRRQERLTGADTGSPPWWAPTQPILPPAAADQVRPSAKSAR